VGTLSCKAVRQRVAAAVDAVAGMRESPFLLDQLTTQTPKTALDGSFSVTLTDSPIGPGQQRQRKAEGVTVTTGVDITFMSNLRGDANVTDYDAALDRAEQVIIAAKGIAQTDLHIDFLGKTAPIQLDGMKATECTVSFRATHRLALQ